MTLSVVKGVNCRFLNMASLLILLTAEEHVPLVTMAGKENSLPSCYSTGTLTGFGAQIKGHTSKCSIKLCLSICSNMYPSLRFQSSLQLHLYCHFQVPVVDQCLSQKMCYLFKWQPHAVGKDYIAILQIRPLRFREVTQVIQCHRTIVGIQIHLHILSLVLSH